MSVCTRVFAASIILMLLAATAAGAAEERNVLTFRFDADAVVVRGATPKSDVVLVGIARELVNTSPRTVGTIRRSEILSDADGDGEVRLPIPSGVPSQGLWAAIDLTSGAHLTAPTDGYPAPLLELPPQILRNDNAGQLRKVEWRLPQMDLFVVRPGIGAWMLYASRASMLDENRGTPHPLRLDVGGMTPLGSSPAAPHHLKQRDVVVIFERSGMAYAILEVGR